MLEIRNLTASYAAIPAIRDVSLTVPEGGIVSIIGANGAGKSTLLKAASGLIQKKNGSIRFDGQDIIRERADRIVARGISHVAEGRQIFAHMTVEDNIHLGAYLYHGRRYRQELQTQIRQMYDMFPILGRRSRQIAGTLSGGEQQMLAIARALMARPKLLLLDEPSMGLAPLVVRDIFAVIQRLNQMGTTILLVEQNARAALRIAGYAYVLETGQMALEGPAATLLTDDRVKAAYLGG
jgi:branched-chain amino acid transport system ATP-binding protein